LPALLGNFIEFKGIHLAGKTGIESSYSISIKGRVNVRRDGCEGCMVFFFQKTKHE